MTDRDPPPVVSDVTARHVLRFVPVDTIDDPDRRDALDSANGVDLTLRKWTRRARWIVLVLAVCVVVRCLVGCAALERAVPGVAVARDVAKVGCALLSASDGSSSDLLAATAAMQRAIVEAQADAAKQRGADQATIDALVRSIAVLSEVVRERAEKVVTAAGNGPAVLPACPAASQP